MFIFIKYCDFKSGLVKNNIGGTMMRRFSKAGFLCFFLFFAGTSYGQSQDGLGQACGKLKLVFLFDQSPSINSDFGYYVPILEELVNRLENAPGLDKKSIYIEPIAFAETIFTWTGKMEPLSKVKDSLDKIKAVDWPSKLTESTTTKLDGAYHWINEIFKNPSKSEYQVVFLVSDGEFLTESIPKNGEQKESLIMGVDYDLSEYAQNQLDISKSQRNVWHFFNITKPTKDMPKKKLLALHECSSRKPWNKYEFFFGEKYSTLIDDLINLVSCAA